MSVCGVCDGCGAHAIMFTRGQVITRDTWLHVTRTRPSFARYVILGVLPDDWDDYCDTCKMSPGVILSGGRSFYFHAPLWWRWCRWTFVGASIFGSLAFWWHVGSWALR